MKLIGKGLTAEVFEFMDNRLIKLFNKGYPMQAILREYINARLVNYFRISGPEVFRIKKIDDRVGIVYSYVKGETIESLFNTQINLEKIWKNSASFKKVFLKIRIVFSSVIRLMEKILWE